ncbi:MAG: glycosyltransferase family 25 protein [Pseudomonadota bacterium]
MGQTTVQGLIIHLARAVERADHVAGLIETFPCPAVALDAVDARTLTPEDRARYTAVSTWRPRYPFPLNDTEIAVFLSHRAAWARIAEGEATAGLIVEDDVELETGVFDRAYALATQYLTEDSWIRLPWKPRETPRSVVAEADGARLFWPRRVALGMQGQIVGRRAARRLLAATETFDRPVDTFLQMTWVTGECPMVVMPAGIWDVSYRMGGTTLTKRKPALAERLSTEAKRAWFRGALAVTAQLRG